MLKINSVNNSLSSKIYNKNHQTFTANTEQKPQTVTNPNVTTDFKVKTPISYSKINELDLPYNLKAHCYKLANGQRVILIPKNDSKTVVKTYVATGSLNEPDNVRGISHYIEHNLFNGSEGIEAGGFFNEVRKMGADNNASTGLNVTDYYISSNLLNESDLENQIRLHASMIETPKFAVDMLEKEKGVVNSEITMYDGYADNILFNKTLKNLFNIKSTSNDLVAGTTKNINNITREDVVDYYNNNYFPANMVTVISGEIDPEQTMSLISKYFAGTNKNTHERKFEKLTPIDKTVRQDLVSDKTNTTLTMLGFQGPRSDDIKSQYCLQIINAILNQSNTGRLTKALKPYNTSAVLDFMPISSRPQDPIIITCNTNSTEENTEKVIQTIYDQIYSITSNPNFDKELNAAKKRELNNFNARFETSGSINNCIGTYALYNSLDNLTNSQEIIKSITKEDIINTAKQYLDLNKTALTVLHPDKKAQQLSFTGNIQKRAINPQDVRHYRLANNIEVVTNNSKTDSAGVVVSFTTPNQFKFNPASLLILNRILQDGSMLRDGESFSADMQQDDIGLHVCAVTDEIGAYINCNTNDLNKAVQSSIEVLQNPRFTQESFDYAKDFVKDSLKFKQKSAYDKLNKELFDGLNNQGYTKEEILSALNYVTLDDVKNLYNNILNTSQCKIVATAPFDKNPQIKNMIFNQFGSLKPVKQYQPFLTDTYKPVQESKVLTDTDTKSQAKIVEGFTFKISGNLKDDVAIDLMNNILGDSSSSRLFTDLREKQKLAYKVGSHIGNVGNTGLMTLSIGTTTDEVGNPTYDNIQKSINGFNNNIKRITSEKVSEKELEEAKLAYKNMILSINETSTDKGIGLLCGMNTFYGKFAYNEILKVIDEITVDDIYNAANYVFAGKPTYSILATKDTLKANEEYLNNLTK